MSVQLYLNDDVITDRLINPCPGNDFLRRSPATGGIFTPPQAYLEF